jgi:hypothetical protein
MSDDGKCHSSFAVSEVDDWEYDALRSAWPEIRATFPYMGAWFVGGKVYELPRDE